MNKQAYDSACADLAESFLRDSTCPPSELSAAIEHLAVAIQQTIEDFMSSSLYE